MSSTKQKTLYFFYVHACIHILNYTKVHQTLDMSLILCIQNVHEYLHFPELERHSDLVVLLQGTVFPAEEFDAEAAAAGMRDAMTGFGECACQRTD